LAGPFPEELAACCSTRSDGNMSLSYADTSSSLINRKNFLVGLGIDEEHLVCAKQVHSSNVKRVGSRERGAGALAYESALPDTDALITCEKNLPLAILTADCLSIFLFDNKNKSIGLAHAGWRGTFEKIARKTVEAMQKEFLTRPEDLRVQLGPSIRNCCYQVLEDFEGKFPGDVDRRGKDFFLDLAGANRRQLESCGVKPSNIMDCAICTSCHNPEYFSYRRESSSCGRMMSVMMLF
jgi:polyphenol oxidase